jgi:hypothetical protein
MRVNRNVPDKLTITDLEVDGKDAKDGELKSIALMFNPESIERTFGGRYAAHSPIGFSGVVKQFVGNDNQEFELHVFYAAMTREEYDELVVARHFCEAIAYASDQATTIQTNAPPKVLIFWPNNLSLVCRVEKVRIKDELYDTSGRVLQFSAILSVFEVVENRFSKERIKTVGPQRRLVEI